MFQSPPSISFLALIGLLAQSKRDLALRVIALERQVEVLMRANPRPRLNNRDRRFFLWLMRVFEGWKHCLFIIRPETVILWHRHGFKYFWRWKSRTDKRGRPTIARNVRELIDRMARENPLWGAPRIHGELLKLGLRVAQSTVSEYLKTNPRPPSQSWKTFLANHSTEIAACDFFTVPTLLFGVLYCFVVLSLDRRRILRVNVTKHPTAEWTAQQIREAYPFENPHKFLIRDRGGNYGQTFVDSVTAMGMQEIKTGACGNSYCERLVQTIKRECADHVIPLHEDHMRRVLEEYKTYYNRARCHLTLDKDAPESRAVHPPENGATILAEEYLGGLHHRYFRKAA